MAQVMPCPRHLSWRHFLLPSYFAALLHFWPDGTLPQAITAGSVEIRSSDRPAVPAHATYAAPSLRCCGASLYNACCKLLESHVLYCVSARATGQQESDGADYGAAQLCAGIKMGSRAAVSRLGTGRLEGLDASSARLARGVRFDSGSSRSGDQGGRHKVAAR